MLLLATRKQTSSKDCKCNLGGNFLNCLRCPANQFPLTSRLNFPTHVPPSLLRLQFATPKSRVFSTTLKLILKEDFNTRKFRQLVYFENVRIHQLNISTNTRNKKSIVTDLVSLNWWCFTQNVGLFFSKVIFNLTCNSAR